MGKFDRFISYLERNKEKTIEVSFSEIERLIGEKLCASAYKYREYWNPSATHTFPNEIVASGYTIKKVDLVNKKIRLYKEVDM